MRLQILPALALSGLVVTALPAGSALAQSRADAEAALTRMGLIGSTSDDFSYADASWSRGRYILSDVVVRNLDIENEDVDVDGPEEMNIARLIFEAPRINSDDDVVFDAFAVEGLSMIDADGGRVEIARIAVDGPNTVMAADLARMLSGQDDFDPDWSAYRFESLGFEGFSARGNDEEGPFGLAVEQFVLQDYNDAELGRMALMNVSVDAVSEGAPVTFRLDELSVTGFQSSAYSELMEAIASGAGEDEVMSAYYRSAFTPQLDLFDRFAMRGLEGSAEGIGFALDNLVGTVNKAGSRYTWDFALDSARIVPDAAQEAGAQVATAIGMLGYESLELSMASSAVYDESTGRMQTIGDNYLELRDGVRLEMTQDFGGYDEYYAALPEMAERFGEGGKEAPSEEAEAVFEMMAPIILYNMSLRIVDQSLLERALEAGAAAQGITTDELRMQTAAMIGMGMMSAPPEIPRPLLSQLSGALTQFINNGGSLTIDVTPPEPVSIGTIAEQVENDTFDYNALGITFSADAPQ